jgi:hypothetical protein
VKAVSGAHGLDGDVREGTRPKAFRLDVLAERYEVAAHLWQLRAAIASVRLQGRHGSEEGDGERGFNFMAG